MCFSKFDTGNKKLNFLGQGAFARVYDVGDGTAIKVYRNRPLTVGWFAFKNPIENTKREFDRMNELYNSGISIPKPYGTYSFFMFWNPFSVFSSSPSNCPRYIRRNSCLHDFRTPKKVGILMEKVDGVLLSQIDDKKTIDHVLKLEEEEIEKAQNLGLKIDVSSRTGYEDIIYNSKKDKVVLIDHTFT